MRFVPMCVLHEMITHFHALDQEKKIKLLYVFNPKYKTYGDMDKREVYGEFPEELYIAILKRLVSSFGENFMEHIHLDLVDFDTLIREHNPDCTEEQIVRYCNFELYQIKEISHLIDGTRIASMYISVLKDINEFFSDLSLELGHSTIQTILELHVTEDQCLEIISGMFDEFCVDRGIYYILRYSVDRDCREYEFMCFLARLEILGQMQLVCEDKYNLCDNYSAILKTAQKVLSSISSDMSDEILEECLQFLLSSEYFTYICFRTHYDLGEFFALQPQNREKYFRNSCFSNNTYYMWFKLHIKEYFENGTSPMTIIQCLEKLMKKDKQFRTRISSNLDFSTMYKTVKNNEENRVAFVSSMKKEIETHGTITMPYIFTHIENRL
jgi:hypothetical protein